MYEIRLMGGLGNQMFQYAVLRALTLEYKDKGIISLAGITNKGHNVYALNHLNISNDIKVINYFNIKSFINYLFYGYYCVFIINSKNSVKRLKRLQKLLQPLGMYCIPDGYLPIKPSKFKHNSLVGYFQSTKYFDKYKNIIKEELKVKEEILPNNLEILKDIQKSNSVCLHIRRGDYVGTKHQVCDDNYYLQAIDKMKKLIKNPKFFIFSDDIKWVIKHFNFSNKEFVYIKNNNPNYEELRLMYNCKHFIISNSSFSWWAQYLTDNEKRITIAPSKWFQTENQHSDIFQDDWIKI